MWFRELIQGGLADLVTLNSALQSSCELVHRSVIQMVSHSNSQRVEPAASETGNFSRLRAYNVGQTLPPKCNSRRVRSFLCNFDHFCTFVVLFCKQRISRGSAIFEPNYDLRENQLLTSTCTLLKFHSGHKKLTNF